MSVQAPVPTGQLPAPDRAADKRVLIDLQRQEYERLERLDRERRGRFGWEATNGY